MPSMHSDLPVHEMAISMPRVNEILLSILETAQSVMLRFSPFVFPLSELQHVLWQLVRPGRNRQIRSIHVAEGLFSDPTFAVRFH